MKKIKLIVIALLMLSILSGCAKQKVEEDTKEVALEYEEYGDVCGLNDYITIDGIDYVFRDAEFVKGKKFDDYENYATYTFTICNNSGKKIDLYEYTFNAFQNGVSLESDLENDMIDKIIRNGGEAHINLTYYNVDQTLPLELEIINEIHAAENNLDMLEEELYNELEGNVSYTDYNEDDGLIYTFYLPTSEKYVKESKDNTEVSEKELIKNNGSIKADEYYESEVIEEYSCENCGKSTTEYNFIMGLTVCNDCDNELFEKNQVQ